MRKRFRNKFGNEEAKTYKKMRRRRVSHAKQFESNFMGVAGCLIGSVVWLCYGIVLLSRQYFPVTKPTHTHILANNANRFDSMNEA